MPIDDPVSDATFLTRDAFTGIAEGKDSQVAIRGSLLDAPEALAKTLGLEPERLLAVVRAKQPGRLSDGAKVSFGWHDLALFVRTRNLPWPRLRLVRAGQHLPPGSFLAREASDVEGGTVRLLGPEVVQELKDGATLIVDNLDDGGGPIEQIAWHASLAFGERCSINAYYSTHKTVGFGRHWDDHDVIVVQVAGCKQWDLWAPTLPHPVKGDRAAEPGASADLRWFLEPGDAAYVPRGWWHAAVASSDSPSLHLAMSVPYRRHDQAVEWSVGALARLRRDAYADMRATMVERSGDPSALLYDPAALERWASWFMVWHDATARPVPWLNDPSLEAKELENCRVRPAWRRPAWFLPRDDDRVILLAAERAMTLAPDAAELVRRFTSTRWEPIAALAETARDLEAIDVLAAEGLVHVRKT